LPEHQNAASQVILAPLHQNLSNLIGFGRIHHFYTALIISDILLGLEACFKNSPVASVIFIIRALYA
jgi:hypothetical protein